VAARPGGQKARRAADVGIVLGQSHLDIAWYQITSRDTKSMVLPFWGHSWPLASGWRALLVRENLDFRAQPPRPGVLCFLRDPNG